MCAAVSNTLRRRTKSLLINRKVSSGGFVHLTQMSVVLSLKYAFISLFWDGYMPVTQVGTQLISAVKSSITGSFNISVVGCDIDFVPAIHQVFDIGQQFFVFHPALRVVVQIHEILRRMHLIVQIHHNVANFLN